GRRPQPTNPARTASPPPMPATVRSAVQPWSGASITENTTRPRPSTEMAAPPTSRGGASGTAAYGTKPHTPIAAAAASTTLTANTDCQPQNSSSMPDTSRPRIAAPPATAAQTPTARTRWASGKVDVMVDSVAGMTRAA